MTAQISTTRDIPATSRVPRHIAVIMDGNGRWARQRRLPRVAGHQRGVEALRTLIRACISRGIAFLTVFAFSSENWRRPVEEVTVLRQLFRAVLKSEVARMHSNGIRLKIIGDLTPFGHEITELAKQGESLTSGNSKLTLTVAANYGGRWDVIQAINAALASGIIGRRPITESDLSPHLSLNFAPEPDLFIRTGGEQRISNFMLWQLAYTELYFTQTLWPDFDEKALNQAIMSYGERERRFGRTSEQIQAKDDGPPGAPATGIHD